jgi:prepilin-type N-terminal cleavage/methylation domain-containing protein
MKKHTTLKSKFNSAFSLVELLVVIAVIAVIAAIAIPNITGARDAAVDAQKSKEAAEVKNMQGQLAALGYAGTVDATTLSNGITVTVTNSDNTTRNVVFKLTK